MYELNVIVSDFENNGRDMDKYESGKDHLAIFKTLMHDLDIKDKFEKYVIVLPNGDTIKYTNGGNSSSYPLHLRDEEGKMLEKRVGRDISDTFENPHLRTIDKEIFGLKIGEKTIQYTNDIYPYNTILVVDHKFKDVALRVLDDLHIETDVHYDYRQLKMF
jgi:hypothetical protein